jgi:hypothetical protein
MLVLALKLVLPPTLIAAASLAGRRWGPGFSGWIVALPLVSGPVVFFLALDQGTSFAAATAHGSLTGAAGQASFCLGYAWSASTRRWSLALAGGTLAFAAGALALGPAVRLPAPALVAILACWIVLALALMPRTAAAAEPVSLGRWDIPWRMMTGTVVVLALTRAGPLLGPRFSGVLAAYPIVTAVLTVFTHRAQGPHHANAVLRGLLLGMFSFVSFYAALELTVERAGMAGGFVVASGAALLTQLATAAVSRGRRTRTLEPRIRSEYSS